MKKKTKESTKDKKVKKLTTSYQHWWNYLLYIKDTDAFRIFVKNVRINYEVPEDGFKKWDKYPFPTPEWKYWNIRDKRVALEKEIREFCRKHEIHHLDGSKAITAYILFDTFEGLPYQPNSLDFCIVSDLIEEMKQPFTDETRADDDRLYPIAIRISPYASERDVLDFVKRVFDPEITSLQAVYRKDDVELGKLRQRDEIKRRRDEFIYQHRHLPRKEIVSLVMKEFGEEYTPVEGTIGKIISIEAKRRK